MAIVVEAPHDIPGSWIAPSVFLAGSIECGSAINWQIIFQRELESEEVILLNPRRRNWDNSWKQEIQDKDFFQQVCWELEMLEKANIIAMYFDPETKSPVSLLELGLFARSGKLHLCCPAGYWRKGNVDIVSNKFGIPSYDTLSQLIEAVRAELGRLQVKNMTKK